MGLFIKQNEQRSQLQTKIADDLAARAQSLGVGEKQEYKPVMMEESEAATGRSLFWVGVVTLVVIALVVFVLFVNNWV